jgi:Ca2+-binding EF-hand superfamily protein
LNVLFRTLDAAESKDGVISVKEFLIGLTLMQSDNNPVEKVKLVFTAFDADNSGSIDAGELAELLSLVETHLTPEQLSTKVKCCVGRGPPCCLVVPTWCCGLSGGSGR